MKYLKLFENDDMSYIENYKKWILFIDGDNKIIFRNIGDELRQVYVVDSEGNIERKINRLNFTIPIDRFKQFFVQDSDNVGDLIDLIQQSNKYNL